MTFDFDNDTTPNPDTSTVEGLMQELESQRKLLIAVATTELGIDAVETEYQHRRQQLVRALKRYDLPYPFPWSSLWQWHSYWKAYLPNYASRRTHIGELVDPVLEALEHQQSSLTQERQETTLQDVEDLLLRFHKVARHFAKPDRYGNTLPIQEEADLQHMLYGILICNFNDVRQEDFAPYRAGARSRIDFLLEEEKIVIETKVTRPGMNDREVGKQLIIDFERYQSAPDCQIVVCYVYDPQGFIQNPTALKKDLEKTRRDIKVKVIIHQ